MSTLPSLWIDLPAEQPHRTDLYRVDHEVADWLTGRRALRLKHPAARTLSCRGHLDALGYRIRRQGLQPLPRVLRHILARVRAAVLESDGRHEAVDLKRSIAASAGVALF